MIAMLASVGLAIVILAGVVTVVTSPYAAAQIKAFADGFTGALKAAKAH